MLDLERKVLTLYQFRCSIVVSISACHAEDPGSIPGGGVCVLSEGAVLISQARRKRGDKFNRLA